MDVKTKELGDITRSKTKGGTFSDADSASTKGKDGYNKGVLNEVTNREGQPENPNLIVDSAKKGNGTTSLDKRLTNGNKLGLPEE